MQDLNDMLYFCEVVDHGGFAAAARALEIPKSKISRRVAELEARLGIRLLHRTTRKLSLTEAGEAYHRHCMAMRDAAEAAEDSIAQVQGEPRGTVKITCPITLAQTVVGELFPEFLALHPKVRLDVIVTNRAVNPVEEGVDIALRVRASVEDSASFVVKKLDGSVGLLVASPAMLGRFPPLVHPHDMAKIDTVAMSAVDGKAFFMLADATGRTESFIHYPRFVADDLHTLKFALLAGTGMGFLPDYMCSQEINDGTLVQVFPGWSMPHGVVHAVFPSRRGLATPVRRFLDFLAERIPAHPTSRCPKPESPEEALARRAMQSVDMPK